LTTERRITIELELPADSPGTIGMVALRRLLKGLLQAYGIRCITIIDANNADTTHSASEQADAPFEAQTFPTQGKRGGVRRSGRHDPWPPGILGRFTPNDT